MKEYWTDTVLGQPVPAGTNVIRGNLTRVYRADTVDDEIVAIKAAHNAETVTLEKQIRDYQHGEQSYIFEAQNLVEQRDELLQQIEDLKDRDKTATKLHDESQRGWREALLENEALESKLRAQGKLKERNKELEEGINEIDTLLNCHSFQAVLVRVNETIIKLKKEG